MNAAFAIETRRDLNLLDVRMAGFFSLDDVARYRAAMTEASRALGGDPGQQRLLCDISEMRIQSQQVVEAFRENMADPLYARRRIAFVVSPTLARTQVQRAMGNRTARLFLAREEAEGWLAEGG
ncbi:hypothetical protein ASE86_02600 [Sphingomonas sp. Leaf33]|uniref:STAS/SEC14 domain-containing protein n=1 Tax=Sphingomonas sp. Leaf33 TaxID=1736215 RepID=UPI000701E175|nr:STAS/SEC14 domain-containing protein [Sphingomonas sp. Leaf33]KQN25166.1 hypothetical protein ASE86_02600 [Sphingomonas sp. Leaf33]